jgi:hypothetical protein
MAASTLSNAMVNPPAAPELPDESSGTSVVDAVADDDDDDEESFILRGNVDGGETADRLAIISF